MTTKKKATTKTAAKKNDLPQSLWDFFLLSGPIRPKTVPALFTKLLEGGETKENLCLLLTTNGGDADSAYRIVRTIKKIYTTFRIFIAGRCKSAGTLIAIGSDEIAFGPFGELGPLDVQISKQDEILRLSSGLDRLSTFGLLTGYAFSVFEDYMLQVVGKSRGTISTKTACEVASNLTTGLFSPLMAQVDPHRLNEVQRAMSVARAYGERICSENLKEDAIDRLISEYPAHSFIIDEDEAASLFEVVDNPTKIEIAGMLAADMTAGCATVPGRDIIVRNVWSLLEEVAQSGGSNDGGNEAGTGGAGADATGKPGHAKRTSSKPASRRKSGASKAAKK